MSQSQVFDEEQPGRSLEASPLEPRSLDEAAASAPVVDEAVELDTILKRMRQRSTATPDKSAESTSSSGHERAQSLARGAEEPTSRQTDAHAGGSLSRAVAQDKLPAPADNGRRSSQQGTRPANKTMAPAREPNWLDLPNGDDSPTGLDIPRFLDEPEVNPDARDVADRVVLRESTSTFGDIVVGRRDLETPTPRNNGQPEQTVKLDTPGGSHKKTHSTEGVTVIDLRLSAPKHPSAPPSAEKRNPIGFLVVPGGAALIVLSVMAYVFSSHRSDANNSPVAHPTTTVVADRPIDIDP